MTPSNNPLIIVGTHRSGTSMLTRILRHQGVFLGHTIQRDDEALFFLKFNRWMLEMAGTNWDHPVPAAELMEDGQDVAALANVIRGHLSGLGTRQFLGGHWLRSAGRISADLDFLWGFKDPCSSLFLPVWLHLFPNARVLRIRRHGIDVAASLRKRHNKVREKLCGHFHVRARLGIAMPSRIRMVDAVRCRSIDGALGVWAEYETALDRWLSDVPPVQQMSIRYEDYLTDPRGSHEEIAGFLGLPLDAPLPEDIRPDPSRAFAYRNDTLLCEDAHRLKAVLGLGGY